MPRVELRPSRIQDAAFVHFKDHVDPRGMFSEAFNAQDFWEVGLPTIWPQDSVSISFRSVLRGLHLQKKNPQGKLVRCFGGQVWDVALDLRRDSPTFGQWDAIELSWERPIGFYIPPGCAHGFYVPGAASMVYYKCTERHDPSSDGGVRWDDPKLGIEWPIARGASPIVSPKDQALPTLDEYLKTLE